MIISKEQAVNIINNQGGKIFRVVFVKKSTGLDRVMVCRKGVSSRTNGGTLNYNPQTYNLLNVFDMQSRGYRMISVSGLKTLKASGVEYAIRP
jgi:hypothetical protein